MKTTTFIVISALISLFSCKSDAPQNVPTVLFGIHETVKICDIPTSILDSLKKPNIVFEKDAQLPVVGYLLKTDSVHVQLPSSNENIKLITTAYTVDPEGKYRALVAINPTPVLTNADIQKTMNKANNVEIHFTLNGSGKWGEMTRKNIGNRVAFVIDGQIYCLPAINGEILNGASLIGGLESDTLAIKLSESLNASIPK